MRLRAAVLMVATGVAVAACGGGGSGDGGVGPDLEIERRMGFSVIVAQTGGVLEIGFNADRDSDRGEAFDITDSLWRIGDGPWNEPPVTCVGRGQRVEMGVAKVQNEARPGLLKERVVWIACLPSAEG